LDLIKAFISLRGLTPMHKLNHLQNEIANKKGIDNLFKDFIWFILLPPKNIKFEYYLNPTIIDTKSLLNLKAKCC
jgi:hypothetical protein